MKAMRREFVRGVSFRGYGVSLGLGVGIPIPILNQDVLKRTTGALCIADPATREVGFDEAQCIECLECIDVCPYAACTSAF